MSPAAAPHDLARQKREHFAAIDTELEQERRRASFNGTDIRPLQAEIVTLVRSGHAELEPEARARLPIHVAAVEEGFRRVEETVAEHASAQTRARRYSDKAHQAALPVYEMEVKVRERVRTRAGNTPLGEGLKRDVGVGETVASTSPLEILDLGTRQLRALKNPDYAELLEQRGIESARLHAQLQPLVLDLRKEIDTGVGPGAKKGDTSDRVADALLWLDIAIERAVAFLEDWGAQRAADLLRARIPRRSRKAGENEDESEEERKKKKEEAAQRRREEAAQKRLAAAQKKLAAEQKRLAAVQKKDGAEGNDAALPPSQEGK